MRSVLGSFTRSGDAVVFGVFGVVQLGVVMDHGINGFFTAQYDS